MQYNQASVLIQARILELEESITKAHHFRSPYSFIDFLEKTLHLNKLLLGVFIKPEVRTYLL